MTVMTNHNDFIHTKLIKHAISKISDYTNNYTNDVAFFFILKHNGISDFDRK